MSQPPQRRRWLRSAARAAISVLLLAWVVRAANVGEIAGALAGVSVALLIAANTLQLVGMGIAALRWGGLLGAQGVPVPTGRLVRSYLVASFFRQLLPSTIGGDVIRAYDSWRAGATRSVALATVAVDRLLGLAVLALFAIAAAGFSSRLDSSIPGLHLWLALGFAALSGGVWAVFFAPATLVAWSGRTLSRLPGPAARPLRKAMDAAMIFRGKRRALVRALVLSVVLQVNVVLFYWLIGVAMGLPVPAADYLLIVPIATFVMMIPISINGIGVRESIFALLLAAYGVDAATAIAFAWLEYASFLLYGVIGGIVYASAGSGPRPAAPPAAPAAADAAPAAPTEMREQAAA